MIAELVLWEILLMVFVGFAVLAVPAMAIWEARQTRRMMRGQTETSMGVAYLSIMLSLRGVPREEAMRLARKVSSKYGHRPITEETTRDVIDDLLAEVRGG